MATLAATRPRARQAVSPGIWLPAFSLWLREIVRFYRQKARVAGVIASPLIFWVVLGAGFAHSFSAGEGSSSHYLAYFFPGSVAMIVLFTAIFSMMSLIQDRNEGFLLSVLAAPVSRSSVVLGKVLGGATLAAIQGIIFLVFAPLVGVHLTPAAIGLSILAVVMISFELTALGFAIAWPRIHPGFPRHCEYAPDSAVAAFRRSVPAERGGGLDALLHDAESFDLWCGGVAWWLVPRRGHAIFSSRQPGGDGRVLPADLCRGLGHREPPYHPPVRLKESRRC